MKVLLLSRYGSLGASSRVRYLQYLNYFRANGLEVEVSPLFSNAYLKALYSGRGRLCEVMAGYAGRIKALLHARHYDVLILEKELFPFLPATAERLLRTAGVPYLVDYDDALFHRYDLHRNSFVRLLLGRKIDAVMRNAAVVVAGNSYLADRARKAGAKEVEIIPTVVDIERYKPAACRPEGAPVVGWIGTPKTSHYLFPLISIFEQLQRMMPVRFVAVGARSEDFAGTPVEAQPWSEETEVAAIKNFDIGIMPLGNTPWERGKCGYKLIQYMACALPVVASPVGVNSEIVIHGENGFLADTMNEWKQSLEQLLRMDKATRAIMGSVGRTRVERWYSLQAQAPRFLQALRKATRLCAE